MKPYILVIDDEPDIRRLVSEILEDEGYAVSVAKDGASARDAVSLRTPSLILLDIWMPDVDGISLLKEFIEKFHLHCPVIMMSGHGTVEAAVEATRLGAYDFIEKPLSLSKLLMTVEKALSQGQGAVKPASFELSVIEAVELVGKSPAVEKLIKELASCAQHDVNVLLNGEAGSGRTYSAKYIHSRSKRNQGPFIELHSATLNGAGKHALELLLGKQLSNGIRPGLLEQGNGGSLYINDVAELNDALQTALYGALTSPAIYRVNGEEPLAVDVRVIAATRYD
ncbi:sigma-54-dependent transcriptional regulator, partial [Kaarinaea lacus]